MTPKLRQYQFYLILDQDPTTNANTTALFQAGCDDALFGMQGGKPYGSFLREAKSQRAAIERATEQVQQAGLKVVEVLQD